MLLLHAVKELHTCRSCGHATSSTINEQTAKSQVRERYGSGLAARLETSVLTCTGHAAASPRAQMVCPSICLVISHSMSISSTRASPCRHKQHAHTLSQSKPTLSTNIKQHQHKVLVSSKRSLPPRACLVRCKPRPWHALVSCLN